MSIVDDSQLTPEKIAELRDEFRYMQDHYSDPADRNRQRLYENAEAALDMLTSRDKRIAELEMAPPAPVGRGEEAVAVIPDFPGRVLTQRECWQAGKEAGLAEARNSPVIRDGWVMVPKEPTEAMMLHRSGCQHHAWDDPDCSMRKTRRLVWANMVAAAPQQEVKQEQKK